MALLLIAMVLYVGSASKCSPQFLDFRPREGPFLFAPSLSSRLAPQLRQLGDVGGDPPGFVAGPHRLN